MHDLDGVPRSLERANMGALLFLAVGKVAGWSGTLWLAVDIYIGDDSALCKKNLYISYT